jgi:hypothetical protein
VLEELDEKLDGGEGLRVGVEIVAGGCAIDHGVRASLEDADRRKPARKYVDGAGADEETELARRLRVEESEHHHDDTGGAQADGHAHRRLLLG